MATRKLKSSVQVIRETEKTFDKLLGSGRQADIPLESLTPYKDSDGTTNDYLFGEVTVETVANLANGIRQDGFNGAIGVWELGDNQYMIFSGHRRAKAAAVVGMTSIPCFVYAYPDDENKRRYIFIRSNILSRGSAHAAADGGDLYIGRQMAYLGDIKKREGFSGTGADLDKEIAKEFATSQITVWRYKTLLSASPRLINAESVGLVPLSQAAKLSKLSAEDQNQLLDIIESAAKNESALSRNDIDHLIDKVKSINRELSLDLVSEEEKQQQIGAFISSLTSLDLTGSDKEKNSAHSSASIASSNTGTANPDSIDGVGSVGTASLRPIKKKRFIRMTSDLLNTVKTGTLNFKEAEREEVTSMLKQMLDALET